MVWFKMEEISLNLSKANYQLGGKKSIRSISQTHQIEVESNLFIYRQERHHD